MEYTILTDYGVYDIPDTVEADFLGERLVELQDMTLLDDYGFLNDCFTAYVIQYGNGEIRLDTIDDAIQSLALKDGADLVEFDDGNIGYIGYYNGFPIETNNFKILRVPTEQDKYAWDYGKELTK